MTVVHETQEDAAKVVTGAFEVAQQHGRWMAAIWSVDEQNRLRFLTRTTFQFPIGDYDACVRGLVQAMRDERKSDVAALEPLPQAELPPLASDK